MRLPRGVRARPFGAAVSIATLIGIGATAWLPQPGYDPPLVQLYLTLAVGLILTVMPLSPLFRPVIVRLGPLLATTVIALVVAMTGGADSVYGSAFATVPFAAAVSGRPRRVLGWAAIAAVGACLPLLYDEPRQMFPTELVYGSLLWGSVIYLTTQYAARNNRLAEENAAVAELRDRIFTAVSHQVRTPLTVIRGGARTLTARDGELTDDTRRRLLDGIEQHSARLERLLGRLLEVAGDQPTYTHRRSVCLETLARAVVADLRIDGRVEVVAEGATTAHVDPRRVAGALTQVLENVVAHTPPATRATVRVTGGRSASIVVEDDGPGIAPSRRRELVEPFRTGSLDGADPDPQLGLGLTLARGNVEAHGGSLRLDDREPTGLVVTMTLPDHDSWTTRQVPGPVTDV